MSCFNDNTVYAIINLFVLVMKNLFLSKELSSKKNFLFSSTYPTRKVTKMKISIIISTIIELSPSCSYSTKVHAYILIL